MKCQVAILSLIMLVTGCTSQATKRVIEDYRKAELHKQAAFDNAMKVAQEQSYLAMTQFISAHQQDPAQVSAGLAAYIHTRDVLEKTRIQYLMGRAFTTATVGQYLYDQQGPFNVVGGNIASDAHELSNGIDEANKAAGVSSVSELAPEGTKPGSVQQRLQELMK